VSLVDAPGALGEPEHTVAVVHTDLAWSFSLVTGVVLAAAAVGWGLAAASGGLKTGGSGVSS